MDTELGWNLHICSGAVIFHIWGWISTGLMQVEWPKYGESQVNFRSDLMPNSTSYSHNFTSMSFDMKIWQQIHQEFTWMQHEAPRGCALWGRMGWGGAHSDVGHNHIWMILGLASPETSVLFHQPNLMWVHNGVRKRSTSFGIFYMLLCSLIKHLDNLQISCRIQTLGHYNEIFDSNFDSQHNQVA